MFRTDFLHIIRSLYTVFIIEAREMHYFSTLFGKELYMFRTDLLPIIRSLYTIFTAIGICHTQILKIGTITSVAVRSVFV